MVLDNQDLSISNLNANSPTKHIFVNGSNLSIEDFLFHPSFISSINTNLAALILEKGKRQTKDISIINDLDN